MSARIRTFPIVSSVAGFRRMKQDEADLAWLLAERERRKGAET